MLDWIQDNRDEFLYHFTEIGEDSAYAEELREEHKQFEENCFVSDDCISRTNVFHVVNFNEISIFMIHINLHVTSFLE